MPCFPGSVIRGFHIGSRLVGDEVAGKDDSFKQMPVSPRWGTWHLFLRAFLDASGQN